jgi:endonuclease-3
VKKKSSKSLKNSAAKLAPSGNPKSKTKIPAQECVRLLKQYYPDAHCALVHNNAFELLVATILSAQCTDERVNKVTPELFRRFPTAQKMAKATQAELEELVKTTGFFRNKAQNLKSMAEDLVSKHRGEVPRELDSLVALAGVGRKTANVVLGNAYGIISGIVVDTHVTRLSNRFAWVKTENAVLIERDLQKIILHEDWILISHLLISHGREICKARKPLCAVCFLQDICPKRGL